MVKQPSELSLDSLWAYRSGKNADFQKVRVVKLGVKYPKRAYVAFLAPEEEGEEMWAPIGRLKCPWEDLDPFKDIEAKWEAVAAASLGASDVQAEVAGLVFGCFDTTNSVNYWAWNWPGVTAVAQPGTFEKIHSIRWADFTGNLCFEDEGELVMPLAETLELMRRLAVSDAPRMLTYLDNELEKAAEEHLVDVARGIADEPHMTLSGSSTRPYIEDLADAAGVIRGWLDAPQVEVWNEIQALRAEIVRLSSIISKASGVLHDHGLTRDATSIRRLHGLTKYPVPRLKSYYEMTREMNKDTHE
ncbi:hypothetical protein ACSVHC_09095 [Arthrobacter sp. KNU-44]|uniref:hypothetical protein n=1 Tax=Arthrobacter sp. KNU-44 TaxID=3450744 RepID=UPI003F4409A3